VRAAHDHDPRRSEKRQRRYGFCDAPEVGQRGCVDPLEIEVTFRFSELPFDDRRDRAIGEDAFDAFDDDDAPDRRLLVDEIVEFQRSLASAASAAKRGRSARPAIDSS
jgi:hypothetical protein